MGTLCGPGRRLGALSTSCSAGHRSRSPTLEGSGMELVGTERAWDGASRNLACAPDAGPCTPFSYQGQFPGGNRALGPMGTYVLTSGEIQERVAWAACRTVIAKDPFLLPPSPFAPEQLRPEDHTRLTFLTDRDPGIGDGNLRSTSTPRGGVSGTAAWALQLSGGGVVVVGDGVLGMCSAHRRSVSGQGTR